MEGYFLWLYGGQVAGLITFRSCPIFGRAVPSHSPSASALPYLAVKSARDQLSAPRSTSFREVSSEFVLAQYVAQAVEAIVRM